MALYGCIIMYLTSLPLMNVDQFQRFLSEAMLQWILVYLSCAHLCERVWDNVLEVELLAQDTEASLGDVGGCLATLLWQGDPRRRLGVSFSHV